MRLIDADELIKRIKENNDLPWNLPRVDQAVGKALEIVKQGGVGVDDVCCEWKYDESYEYAKKQLWLYGYA